MNAGMTLLQGTPVVPGVAHAPALLVRGEVDPAAVERFGDGGFSDPEAALAAYDAIEGPCRLDRMGPVFATKLLYLAGRGSSAPRPYPLVLDRMIGTLLAEHGEVLRWGRFQSEDYERYLRIMTLVADRVRAMPDDVECALFSAASDPAR